MAKINILSSEIFNRIAAGEVVERPSSVVKELIENSIDANAKHIEIEIKNGGLEYIKVTDDGAGMDYEDIQRAFLPHATSKISSIDDLNSIMTLGFRGEALASIAAVSKVTIISKTPEAQIGNRIISDYGDCIDKGEFGCKTGTTVIVENLFKKIPARAKFMKTPRAEESLVVNLIDKFILANPNISFSFKSENKSHISDGSGLDGAIISVIGKECPDLLLPISFEGDGLKISGYISKPEFSKPSRSFQTLVVNGRFVENKDVSASIYVAYKDFLMTRQFPVFVLYIDLPSDLIDVNVHPSKMEIKFAQSEKIKRILIGLVSSTLKNSAQNIRPLRFDDSKQVEDVFSDDSTANYNISKTLNDNSTNNLKSEFEVESKTIFNKFETFSDANDKYDYKKINSQNHTIDMLKNSDYILKEGSNILSHLDKVDLVDNSYQMAVPTKHDEISAIQQDALNSEFFIVGKLFNTYIIVQAENDVYFIDQHAAHERLIYDKLKENIECGKNVIQNLLVPYIFSLSYDESETLESNLNNFAECGFDITRLSGNNFAINAVPLVCENLDCKQFLSGIFDSLEKGVYNKFDFIKDHIAQSACKAAVKGADDLNYDEIKSLLHNMQNLQILLCPHGRPVIVRISKKEIEKWFNRRL